MQALPWRRKAAVAAGIPAAFTGLLMTDGYAGYQHLLSRLAGIQQCCQHIIRRCRVVIKLGPGGLQSWAADIIATLREAHQGVEDARARGSTALDADLLDKLRQRYDEAAAFGITRLLAARGRSPDSCSGKNAREFPERWRRPAPARRPGRPRR